MSPEITLLAQLCLHYFLYNVFQECHWRLPFFAQILLRIIFFAQLFLHKYYYIYNVLQKSHKKINFLHKYFLIYRAFFYWSLKVSLAVLGFKYSYLPKVPWFPPITPELGY